MVLLVVPSMHFVVGADYKIHKFHYFALKKPGDEDNE